MRSIIRAATLCLGTASLAACSGGGIFGQQQPGGTITLLNESTGATINSSVGSPFIDGTSAFTVTAHESFYRGPYTAAIIKWNNNFNEPCYGTMPIANTTNTEFTVYPVNAAAPGTAADANPCGAATGEDEETLQVSDGKGNNAYLYFTY